MSEVMDTFRKTIRYKIPRKQKVMRWKRYNNLELTLANWGSGIEPRFCEGEVVYPECGSLHKCDFHEQDFFIVDWID